MFDRKGASCSNHGFFEFELRYLALVQQAATALRRRQASQGSSKHEAHLPTVQSPPRTHARISLSHEDPRRSWCDQRTARQGPQASRDLRPASARMLGRIERSADFELALASPAKARSAHFAAHHVALTAAAAFEHRGETSPSDLSTMNPKHCAQAVDDIGQNGLTTHWLGVVVPKRHARRAATRSLLRRQIRAAVLRHEHHLASGMWLVRLRAPFVRTDYASATSAALRSAARDELDRLLARASH